MNQNKLTESISEGIYIGVAKISRDIAWAIGIILGLFIIFIIFHSNRYDSTEQQAEQIRQTICNSIYLTCSAIDHSVLLGGEDCSINSTDSYGNVACATSAKFYPVIKYSEQICGYQEANAWFEQVKNNFHGDKNKLYLDCT